MDNLKYDYLIVGSGLFGSVFAYLASQKGKRCLVIDKRSHIGGNVYCEEIENINVHKYGAHIFHTSDVEVWNFVTSLVEFNNYINAPVAVAPDDNLYNLPFNMNTFHQIWGIKTPDEARKIIDQQRRESLKALNNRAPENLEEQALCLVGKDIFELLIKGYTEKQWGRKCTELPPFIIRRLPIRFVYDNNYFNDKYQGIPKGGYNNLINKLLEGSEVKLKTDFFTNKEYWKSVAHKIVFTGKIDEYFDYKYGKLEYRSVRFETEVLNLPNFQGNAVINYTSNQIPYTRIIEHKHFEEFGDKIYENSKTVISKEYPEEWNEEKEPFYPINNERNQKLYEKYRDLSLKEESVIFGGRLAEYKYYDMAPIIRKVLDMDI